MATVALIPVRSREYLLAIAGKECIRCKKLTSEGYRCNVCGERVVICDDCMADLIRGVWFFTESGDVQ